MSTEDILWQVNSVNREWRINNLQARLRRLEKKKKVDNKPVKAKWEWTLNFMHFTTVSER